MTQQTFPIAAEVPRRRKLLLESCAIAAIASALVPQAANAQAFNGGISSSVNASRTSVGTGTETITVSGSTATIDWAPNESGTGTIDFLPSGNVATFTSTSGTNDYTVLNRIVPRDTTRGISLNGTIESFLEGSSTTGGKVWFYSPGGIIVGANAVINVGGLLLSTADVLKGWTADANGFSASFSATPGSTSAVQILDGAQINALQQNSYVAIVAPRVEQGGNVQVNGTAAYVAGEQVTLTMNQGLFDIQVDAGTTDGNGIVHTGATGGPSSGAVGDPHRVYMVAVPKNQALTMLLGGNVGFQPATVAGVENGEIVLSSGKSINDTGSGVETTSSGAVDSGIAIGPGNYTSDLVAYAAGDISLLADTGPIDFAGDVTLYAQRQDGSGADVTVEAAGNSIDVAGLFSANVDGLYPSAATTDSSSGDGFGGNIAIYAFNEGAITTGGLQLSANGAGQDGSGGASATGGTGFGGNIFVNAESGGSITINGDVNAVASGFGGDMLGSATAGGAGHGGNVTMSAGNGTIAVTGDVAMNAEGFGGTVGEGGSGGLGGSAFGGFANIQSYGPGSISVGGTTNLVANAAGGNGQSGGDAYGGNAGISGSDGTITLGGIYAAARGSGGSATYGFGGNGGYGQGGAAYVEADSVLGNIEVLPSNGTIVGGDAILDVTGTGGDGAAGDGALVQAGAGGGASGGFNNSEVIGGAFALAQSDGATIQLGKVTAIADAYGGAGGLGGAGQSGGAGGTAFGGLAQAGEYDPNGLGAALGSATFGDLDLRASGHGGDGGSGATGDGDGGAGFGGFAVVNGRGDVVAGSAILAASGLGGAGSNGGVAAGGDVFVQAYGDSSMTFSGDVSLDATADGGDGSNGSGGDAFGGFAETGTTADGATLTIAGRNSLDVSGTGGSGTTTGGSGFGGTAYFDTNGTSSATAGSLAAIADGIAGAGGVSSGSASGGSVHVLAQPDGTVTLGDVILEALGPGGFVDLNWGDQGVPAELAPLAVQTPGVVYATNITANSGGDIAVGDVNFTGLADLTAAGTANFYGLLSGPTITVTSTDINVADGGSLGDTGVTDLITLNAVSDNPIIVGGPEGASAPGQYTLSEPGRITAGAVVVNAIPSTGALDPDVLFDALTIEGSQTIGGGSTSSVTFNTGGSIVVQGLVDFINAGPDDSLTLNAGGAIEVITDTGGISMTDSSGVLSGVLTLNAPDIWVASQSIIDQLEVDPNFSGRVDALRTNDGPVNADGYVRAGAITAKVGKTFFVQNSGTADEFAGITVGDGGLTIISTAGPAAAAIAPAAAAIAPAAALEADVDIYGRQQKSDGTQVLNNDFAAEVPVSGNFTENSTINDCPLGGCPPPPPPPPPPELPPQLGPESILGPIYLMSSPRLSVLDVGHESNSDSGLDTDLIDTGPLSADDDIKEPVTSGGDDPSQPK